MRASDTVRLALANVRRNRTRSLLTLVGVAVGVGALLTLVSYGAALQSSAKGEFDRMELYNTLRVTSRATPFSGGIGEVAYRSRDAATDTIPEVALTDSLIGVYGRIPGVLAAYPEVAFPVKIEANDRDVFANAEAIPMAFGSYPSYRPTEGAFFTSERDSALLMSPSMAARLGFTPASSAVGDSVTLVTATLDLAALSAMQGAFAFGMGTIPTRDHRHRLRVAGLLPEDGQAVSSFVRVLVPLGLAQTMQKLTFFSTIDLLLRRNSVGGYAAVRVQLRDADAHEAVRARVRETGAFVTSAREQFAQLDRLFLIVDMALGIVGIIALLVATLGIANTMMMNVMERRREIGVMKAVGGDERDVVRLFLVESAALGLVGGVLGVASGFAVMGLLQLAISTYLSRRSLPEVIAFDPSVGLVAVVLLMALVVSLIAGLAPARRAARVEPVEALRGA